MIIHKPIARGLASWQSYSEEPGIKDLVWDDVTYANSPRSIRNPELGEGEAAVGVFTAFCNGIDFDYKWNATLDAFMTMYAQRVDDPEDQVIIFYEGENVSKPWTHIHADLDPGEWRFVFGVAQTHATPCTGWFDNIEFSPAWALAIHPPPPPPIAHIPEGAFYFSGASGGFVFSTVPSGAWRLSGHVPHFGPLFADLPAGRLALSGHVPARLWYPPLARMLGAREVYVCVLTGDGDGLDDIELPMSSFQTRMQDGQPSYLSVVVPNSAAYQEAISARANGDLILKMGYLYADGTRSLEEVVRTDYQYLQIDRGARSDAVTITGFRTTASEESKEVVIRSKPAIYGVPGSANGQGSL